MFRMAFLTKRARFALRATALALVLQSLLLAPHASEASQSAMTIHVMPNNKTLRVSPRGDGMSATPEVTTGNGISYNGGPIMSGNINVYLIWYGSWSGNSATTILPDFMSNIGGSAYFNINTTYSDFNNNTVANVITYAGSTTDNYSQGTQLSDAAVQAIVSSAITSGRLPSDPDGVYFVLTSPDVNETSGWCSAYCGWHTHGTIAGTDIKFAFVGDPANCSSCVASVNQSNSPNGNIGADAMASVMAHELEETATDPDLNAWNNGLSQENADMCAWNFGNTLPMNYTVSGSANVVLGDRKYLIQQNWINAYGGGCRIAKQINTGSWIQITDDVGDVLPEASSIYESGVASCQYNVCQWDLWEHLGPVRANTWAVLRMNFSACSPAVVSGYNAPIAGSCRVDATPSAYGN